MERAKTPALKMSPNVRLRMTLGNEMSVDKGDEIFTEELRQKHVLMHRQATEKMVSLAKSLVFSDVILTLLISGKDMTLPLLNISTSDIPAAVEVFAVFSSLSFMFLCLTFQNEQFYRAIVEVMSARKAHRLGVDSDFVASGDIYTEFYVKTFRSKMNIFNFDFYVPGTAYKLYYGLLSVLIGVLILCLVFLHFALVGYAVALTSGWTWILGAYAAAVVLMNVVGVLSVLGISLPFELPPAETAPPMAANSASSDTTDTPG